MNHTDSRAQASAWARTALTRGCVVLDTETTGLNGRGRRDEPCQIAVVDHQGAVLLNTLVKPTIPIPSDATRIHRITNAMVQDAPTFADIVPQLQAAVAGRIVVVYNASFDAGILQNALHIAGLPPENWGMAALEQRLGCGEIGCAMMAYAHYRGEWNNYRHSYAWHRLTDACHYEEIHVKAAAHSALGDALLTLGLVRKMAGASGVEQDAF